MKLLTLTALTCAAAFGADLRIGIIGTDTSHVPAFTRTLNDPNAPDHIPGARVVAAYKGGSKDVKANELWRQLLLPDDPVKQSNKRGYLSFATRGPSTRSTQVFINLKDNKNLDSKGFAPFGRVVEGIGTVDNLYAGYGEVMTLGGGGPDPAKLEAMGDEYAQRSFPRLDSINSAKVIEYTPKAGPATAKKAVGAKKTR